MGVGGGKYGEKQEAWPQDGPIKNPRHGGVSSRSEKKEEDLRWLISREEKKKPGLPYHGEVEIREMVRQSRKRLKEQSKS